MRRIEGPAQERQGVAVQAFPIPCRCAWRQAHREASAVSLQDASDGAAFGPNLAIALGSRPKVAAVEMRYARHKFASAAEGLSSRRAERRHVAFAPYDFEQIAEPPFTMPSNSSLFREFTPQLT